MNWDELALELQEADEWGDFAAAGSHARIRRYQPYISHPVELIVNANVPDDHFATYAPILVRALGVLRPRGHAWLIARALTRKGLTSAVPALLNLFHDTKLRDDHQCLYSAGNAVYTIDPKSHLDDIIAICRDDRLNDSRNRLIEHLSRFKKSETAYQTLIELLEDERVRGAALEALKRYGDPRAISAIERTPVREGDDFVYERHQKEQALKRLSAKAASP